MCSPERNAAEHWTLTLLLFFGPIQLHDAAVTAHYLLKEYIDASVSGEWCFDFESCALTGASEKEGAANAAFGGSAASSSAAAAGGGGAARALADGGLSEASSNGHLNGGAPHDEAMQEEGSSSEESSQSTLLAGNGGSADASATRTAPRGNGCSAGGGDSTDDGFRPRKTLCSRGDEDRSHSASTASCDCLGGETAPTNAATISANSSSGASASEISLRLAPVQLLCRDFLTSTECWVDADLLFATSLCFPPELVAELEIRAKHLRKGARVLCMQERFGTGTFRPLPIAQPEPPPAPPHRVMMEMSFGSAAFFLFERM